MTTSESGKNNRSILADQPICALDADIFEFKKYAKTLTEALLSAESPITFGIFGRWGTGKTSLMRIIYEDLKANNEATELFPVWFDAWRYQSEDNLLIPLLYTIRDEIRKRNPKRNSTNPYERLARVLDHFTKALASGIDISTKFGETTISYKAKESLAAAQKIAEEYDKLKDSGKSTYYDLFYYLEGILKDLLPARIVIFVDDLDRCQPAQALHILESMKLSMNIEGIIFVIAADREILERITEKAKYGENAWVDGNLFLKKMIQVFFNLPPLSDASIERYVGILIDKLDALQKIPRKEKATIIKMFSLGAGANPREIKRIINNFSILYRIDPAKNKSAKIALMLVIQQRWPLIFQSVLTNREVFVHFCEWVSGNWKKGDLDKAIGDWYGYLLQLPAEIQKVFSLLLIDASFLEFLDATKPDLSFSNTELEEYIYFSAIGSMGMVRSDDLKFSETVEDADGKFKWVLRPDAPTSVLERIEQITYILPPTIYPNHQRVTTSQDGFMISDFGENNVTIRIKVTMKNGSVLTNTHYLNLTK